MIPSNIVLGSFEFGTQTLGEGLLGSFVFDPQGRKTSQTFGNAEAW